MSNVTFVTFDQLIPSPKFAAANQALLDNAKAAGFKLVGVEVTDPTFAKQLDVNIDPQHAEGLNISATKVIFEQDVVEGDKIALFTTRLDCDSVAGMGLIYAKLNGGIADVDALLVEAINTVDTTKTDAWSPTPVSDDVVVEISDYAALSEYYRTNRGTVEEKVFTTLAWLRGEDVSETLASASKEALANKRALGEAIKNGSASITVTPSGVAVFKGPGVGGAGFAYKFAPVGILYDAVGSRNSGCPKWTICQFSAGYANIPAITAELNTLEGCGGTWGGNPSLTGSPQEAVSTISEEQILEIVERHIFKKTTDAIVAEVEKIKANLDFVAGLA